MSPDLTCGVQIEWVEQIWPCLGIKRYVPVVKRVDIERTSFVLELEFFVFFGQLICCYRIYRFCIEHNVVVHLCDMPIVNCTGRRIHYEQPKEIFLPKNLVHYGAKIVELVVVNAYENHA